jgi:hypothetical protein
MLLKKGLRRQLWLFFVDNMIKLKIKGNFKRTINKLESTKDSLDGKTNFYLKLAQLLNASIQIRVQRQGLGVDNKKMPAYSQKYSEWKKNKGRKTGYRDLTFSGNMFKSLTSEQYQSGARMFFNSSAETNKARGNQNRFKFFGISDREINIIKREIKKLISNKDVN